MSARHQLDIGPDSLQAVVECSHALSTGQPNLLAGAIPHAGLRRHATKVLVRIFPRPTDDYRLKLRLGSLPPVYGVRPPDGQLKDMGLSPPEIAREESSEWDSQSMPVQIEGIARLREGGLEVKSLRTTRVRVVDQHDLSPHRPQSIRWGTRDFLLNEALDCHVQLDGHFIVVKYEPLGDPCCPGA